MTSPRATRSRMSVNTFPLSRSLMGHAFDAVIDLDKRMRDPVHRDQLNSAFDSGDHLHPNDAGYKAMASAIDRSLLLPAR
jgi:lysophospholipase L1-like esterase